MRKNFFETVNLLETFKMTKIKFKKYIFKKSSMWIS